MGQPSAKLTSPRKQKPTVSSKAPKKVEKPIPKVARLCWSQGDTKKLLEVLVVLKSQGFDPNDTNEWLNESHSKLIQEKLVKVKVNEAWSSSIAKCRKKYMNIKANYASQV